MHDEAHAYVGRFAVRDELAVLDIGGRDLNGSVRGWFPKANPYRVLDIEPGENVDIVADAIDWEPDRPYDLVVCCEVLEHVRDWGQILGAAWRALRPGGRVIVTAAGPGRFEHSGREALPYLLDGEWYANIEPAELEAELATIGFDTVQVEVLGADVRATALK